MRTVFATPSTHRLDTDRQKDTQNERQTDTGRDMRQSYKDDLSLGSRGKI